MRKSCGHMKETDLLSERFYRGFLLTEKAQENRKKLNQAYPVEECDSILGFGDLVVTRFFLILQCSKMDFKNQFESWLNKVLENTKWSFKDRDIDSNKLAVEANKLKSETYNWNNDYYVKDMNEKMKNGIIPDRGKFTNWNYYSCMNCAAKSCRGKFSQARFQNHWECFVEKKYDYNERTVRDRR